MRLVLLVVGLEMLMVLLLLLLLGVVSFGLLFNRFQKICRVVVEFRVFVDQKSDTI